jgi:nitrate reductase NapAB chaperone NapD
LAIAGSKTQENGGTLILLVKSQRVDALEQHLEKMEKVPSVKGKKGHEQP